MKAALGARFFLAGAATFFVTALGETFFAATFFAATFFAVAMQRSPFSVVVMDKI
jgi:hypothetical protein